LFLLDQSYSMNDSFAGNQAMSRAKAAAEAINDLLMDLIVRCTLNFQEGTRHYFDVGVIGYGSRGGVGSCLGGALKGQQLVSVAEFAASPLRVEDRPKVDRDESGALVTTTIRYPVWIDPVAEGGTPMAEAMQFARRLLEPWAAAHKKSYPPIVINITDGEPAKDPTKAARALTGLRSDDGDVLLYNLHLSSLATAPITFPAHRAELPDKFAAMLFDISSEVPPQILQELGLEGYPAEPGTRGFVFNSDGSVMIQFLDIGTRVTMEGAARER
jgi:hypothetical protein